MDQIKIGTFIAARRKAAGLTQLQLAERLGITDRAVSKWETGRAMPDAALMLDLCQILEITVNDLLCGEVVTVERYDREMEQNLLGLVEQKQEADRRLLRLETVMGFVCIGVLLALAAIAAYAPIEEWLRITLILVGLLPVLVAVPFMIKIEQSAGYYECARCHHRYVPQYKSVFIAAHLGRTRYLRCPVCKKRSWQKKKLSKDE